MTFTLKIEMGNDAMQFSSDLANAVHKVANHLENINTEDLATVGQAFIRDINGNTVGYWRVK